MPPRFNPLPGAEGWQLSNPPILSLAPLLASLDLFDEAGMKALRAKSEKLTGYLERLLIERCGDKVAILTPPEPAERGCQLSIRLQDGKRIHERLIASGVTCDWREPDVIRLAPVPLYNRFVEVFDFVDRLQRTLEHA
jgi:kynureninase